MKHNWEKDENGNVNEWAWESGFHNGVFCVDCGKSVCVHCDPDYMELDDCTGPEPGIDAATALSTLRAENEKLRAELESLKKGHCAGCSVQVVETEALRDLNDAPKLRAELERMKKIMRDNGIMVIPSKYPGGRSEWNIPKPRGQKED